MEGNNKEFGYLPLVDPEVLRIAVALEKISLTIGGDVTDIAVTKAAEALASASRARAWAVGEDADGNPVENSDETHKNNARYYAQNCQILVNAKLTEIASAIAAAEQAIEDLEKEAGYAWFDVNDEDGKAYVTVVSALEDTLAFSIDEQTGQLNVIVAEGGEES